MARLIFSVALDTYVYAPCKKFASVCSVFISVRFHVDGHEYHIELSNRGQPLNCYQRPMHQLICNLEVLLYILVYSPLP